MRWASARVGAAVTSPSARCRVCGHPLRDRASVAVRLGRVCAARADQVPLHFDEREHLLALGVAPANVPHALAARARARALGLVPVPGCPGCELYGACILHSPPPRGTSAPSGAATR